MSDVTPRFGFPFLHAGQAQKELWHNEALMLADMLVHAQAVSASLSTPPPAPEEGTCWIVDESPTGSWTGKEGMIACWTGGLYFSDLKVVGERQPEIATPTGGSSVDAEARAAILAILNALRNHGLIAGGA